MADLTPIINAAIALTAAVVTAFVIPWIKRNTTQKDREEMLAWVEIAVTAAQQLFHQLDGAKRKEYVLEFLAVKGYRVDDAAIDAAIEAAVLKLHREQEAGA